MEGQASLVLSPAAAAALDEPPAPKRQRRDSPATGGAGAAAGDDDGSASVSSHAPLAEEAAGAAGAPSAAHPAAAPRMDRAARKAAKQAALLAGAWERCLYVLPKKHRHCTGMRVPGSDFCGAHQPEGAAVIPSKRHQRRAARKNMAAERIPCPVDPGHTVFAYELNRHVRVCSTNSLRRRQAALPFFAPGCNAGSAPVSELAAIAALHVSTGCSADREARHRDGDDDESGDASDESSSEDAGVDDNSAEEAAAPLPQRNVDRVLRHIDLRAFASKVKAWYDAHVGHIPTQVVSTPEGDTLLSGDAAAGRCERTVRHTVQQTSIVGHMLRAGLVAPHHLMIEFGAGRGGLSLTLDRMRPGCHILLVERNGGRRKADGDLRMGQDKGSGTEFARVRIDIADIQLAAVPTLWGATPLAVDEQTARDVYMDPGIRAATMREWRKKVGLRSQPATKELVDDSGGTTTAASSARDDEATSNAERSSTARSDANELPVVGIGKHLCGGATDLALRCLVRALHPAADTAALAGDVGPRPASSSSSSSAAAAVAEAGTASAAACPPAGATLRPRMHGVAIATCCHHACSWPAYVGKEWFRDVLGASAVDFEVMRCVAPWINADDNVAAVAKKDCAGTSEGASGDAAAGVFSLTGAAAAATKGESGELTATEKAVLGRMCKRLIDAGRVHFLQNAFNGFTAGGSGSESSGSAALSEARARRWRLQPRMVHYCDVQHSPENALLLATAEPLD